MKNDHAEDLVSLSNAILESPKYGQIDSGLISHIGLLELKKGRKLKDAIKATKNKLHQIGGAYITNDLPYEKWLAELGGLQPKSAAFKNHCREIMTNHASTKERLSILDEYYSEIFADLPPIKSILDLACGLNPLAAAWMPLTADTIYYACDIYYDLMFFVGKYLEMMPFQSHIGVCDVLSRPPTQKVDLALVQKTIPCLEQVNKQAGEILLENIQADYYLITFPAQSLGGKDKGMMKNYEERFKKIAEGKQWEIKKYVFKTELAFLAKAT
ncbi:MAG: 16S rRNA methyltransferase [Chloroflexota bacterium]